MQNKFSKLLRSECPPPRDSWLFAEGKHEGIVRGMTLEECLGNHPVITLLSPRNHPLLSRVWKYVACMLLALVLAIGNVWAADPQDTYYKFTSTASSGANVAPVSGDGGNITLGNNSAAKITAQNAWYMGVTYTHAININSSDAKSFSLNISASTENPAHVFVLVTSDNRTIKLKNGSTDVDQCGVRGTAGISSYTAAASLVELVTTKTGSHVIYASGSAFVYAVRVVYEKNSLWNEIKGLSDVTLDKDKTLADDLSTLYFFRMQDFCFNTDGVIPSGGAVSNGLRFSINFKAQQDGEVTVNYANPGGSGRNLTVTEFTRPTTAGTSIVNQSVAKNTTTYADKKFDVEAGKEYVVGFNGAGATIKSINFKAATSWTITYDANGGTGTMENSTNNVADCGFTYESKDFAGWKDGEGNDYEVGEEVNNNVTLYAQWVDHVAKYTLIYKVDGVEKGRETVNVVGGTPEGITAPTKDYYTFAGWSPALTDVTGTDGAEVETNATWTPNYTSGTYEFTGNLTMGTDPQMTIENNSQGKGYSAGRIDNIYVDAQTIGYEATGNYGGWKLKSQNKGMRFLVENASGIRVTLGEANPLRIEYTEGGVAKSADIAKSTTSSVYKADANTIVRLTNTTTGTVTLKKLEILPLYNATYTTSKSSVDPTSASNVTEVTLPTPSETTVGGYSFTGWVANQTVYDGETPKTAGEALDAGGTYTLTAPTTFTAQWVEQTEVDVKFFQGYGEPDVQIETTQSIETGNKATAPENPTREGYKFLGWSTDGTEANIVDIDAYTITTATTFTAVWKQVWTVTFDGAGNVEVENGEKVASPNSPVQAGKVFQGWYNGESKYDFSATVTGNLALTSKWANADANHYVYAYNDDFHFDGVVYKTPEGKVDAGNGNETIGLGATVTLFSGEEGITSVVAADAQYDSKGNDSRGAAIQYVTAMLKLKEAATSKVTITIKSGYTATLKIKSSGFSAQRTINVSDATPASASTTGSAVGSATPYSNTNGELTFALTAGAHDITVSGGTLYISEMDIEAELIPTYTVTYAKGNEGASDQMTDDNSYYAGDEVTLLNNVFGAPTGMIWSAWSVKDANNNDVEVVNGKFAMPASNVTVTAVWAVDNGMAKLYRSDDTEDANNPYATLVEAVAAAQDGDKIVLQRNVTDGAGIMLTTAQAKEITIDFGGFTYTAVSPGVGSTGTQNQAFHLEKGNTVTLKNGTIACSGSEIKMLIQNYCDLTLENITLDGTGLEGSHRYVMSNNCGDVVIGDGTTITAKTGDVAFDVCATNYYPDGVTVTVKDGASITGIVEYDVWGTKPAENKAELAIEGGEFNVTWNVEEALAEDAKKNLNVSGGSFTEVVPVDYCAEGFVPVTEADLSGKYEVTPGYKVTFVDVDGDEELELETVGVEAGEAVAAIEIADKIGYEFDAWYTESENAWDFTTVVTADMKLYAKWNVFEGCVMLKPAKTGDAISANDAIAMQEGSFGATMKALTDNLSYNTNGLLFGTNSSTKAEVTLSNNTLKAGTVITAVIYNADDNKARGLSLLTKDGASVANATWTAEVVGTHTETYTVQAGDGLEGTNAFQLKREQNAYLQSIKITNCGAEPVTVTFKSANETLIAEEVIEKGTKVVAPAAPHVSGKRFIGWSETKNDAENLVNLTTTDIDADVIYYAVYEDVVCPTEGTVFSMAITDPAGTEYEENNNFGLEIGATYVGGKAYSGSKNGTKRKGEIDTNGEYSFAATGDLTVKVVLDCALAEGDVISFTTTTTRELKIQKVAGSDLVTTSGKKYTIPAESPLIGLDEFYLERGNSESTFKTFRIDRPYTISFDMQEHGAAIAAQKLLAGEKVAEPAAPTADGYDFFGWYKEAACTNAWDFDEDLVSASATLYAKWDVHRADIATLKSLKYGDDEILVADQYEYDIELPYATTAVPALSAVATSATAHSVDITNASAFDEDGKATSKVVVTAEDEVTTQTYWVHFTKAAALEQTLVTETTVWDWTKAGGNVDKKTTAQGVMANEIGIVNNADFNSQALWYKGRYPKRNNAYFQGAEIRIETTVPGVIYVEYSNTGGNSARTVEINGVKGLKSTDDDNVKVVDSIAVNAGTVVIKGIQVSDNAASDLRIFKITFNTAADHTRENLNPSNIGTLCWKSNAMLIGATLYELAGKNENGYLVFDEVSENRLEAGKGYVFVPENGNTEIKVYNTDKKMAKTEPENVEVGLQGTFEELTSAEGENSPLWDNYIITNNHFVHINSTNVGVRANRAYIRGFESIPQAGAPQQASNGAPRRRLVMEGNPAPATATDIDNIFGNDTKAEKVLINGQLFILRGGKMFDAAGQLVK